MMSKIDKLKEEIGWLKAIFGILIVTDISLLAWLAQNYNHTTLLLNLSCGIAGIILTVIVAWINRVAYQKIEELEDL